MFPLPNDVFIRGHLARDLRISYMKHSLNGGITGNLVLGCPSKDIGFPRVNSVISTTYLTRSVNGPPFKRSKRQTVSTCFTRNGKGGLRRGVLGRKKHCRSFLRFRKGTGTVHLLARRFVKHHGKNFTLACDALTSVVGCPCSSICTKGGKGFNFFRSRRRTCLHVTGRLNVDQGPRSTGEFIHCPLICLIRTTSSVYCRVVSVRSTCGLRVLAARRTVQLLLGFFRKRHLSRVIHIVGVMSSAGRRVTCLHSYVVNLLISRYSHVFLRGRRSVLDKACGAPLVSGVYSRTGTTCSAYSGATCGGVCHTGRILSVRLTNCRVFDRLVSALARTIVGRSRTCDGLLLRHVPRRCSAGTPAICNGMRYILSCVSNVASMCTLSLCHGVANVDLPTIWCSSLCLLSYLSSEVLE